MDLLITLKYIFLLFLISYLKELQPVIYYFSRISTSRNIKLWKSYKFTLNLQFWSSQSDLANFEEWFLLIHTRYYAEIFRISYLIHCKNLANFYQILRWVMSRIASLDMEWPSNSVIERWNWMTWWHGFEPFTCLYWIAGHPGLDI